MLVRPLALCLALPALLAAPCAAEVLDRASLTLGALADESDRIVLARVTSLEDERVRLEVLDVLKGRPAPLLGLPRGRLAWRSQEQLLLFLREGPDGAPAPLRSAWHKVSVPDAAARDHLLEVVRGRLPTVGGDPLRLRAALFFQLESALPRVREDAGLELLAWPELTPGGDERAALRRALAREVRPELLELAARLPEPALLPAVLAAGRAARDPRLRELSAAALRAIDPRAALDALALDLRQGGRLVAASTARLLGALGGPEAERLLEDALGDARPEVRKGALRGLGDLAAGGLADPTPLLALVRGPEREAARKALAALARGAQGAALREVEQGHPDPELRALAARLREDPTAAGELLGE